MNAIAIGDAFRQAMEKAGLVPPEVIPPGKIIRFPGVGKSTGNKSGWAWLSEDGQGGAYGDWASGLSEAWAAQQKKMTPAERTAHATRVADAQRIRHEEEVKQHKDAAQRAQAIWNQAASATDPHPYLVQKQITFDHLVYGLRVDAKNNLLVPVENWDGLSTLQFIAPNGDKQFLPGGKVKGGWFCMGGHDERGLIVCEGLATGGSLHKATGLPVVVAFTAHNLTEIAQGFRQDDPAETILICGDNDIHEDGKPNTGLLAATAAAKAIKGILVMPELDGKKCDWNDIACAKGLDAVREAIEAALQLK